MNLDKINIINHELSNFKNSIERLKRELDDIENGDKYEYNQLCETLCLHNKLYIDDIEYLYKKMDELKKSGVSGLYVDFEEVSDDSCDDYADYYTNAHIYGDIKYAQEKLDKRKSEIMLKIENYNKRIEDYKEQLKVEVNCEMDGEIK